MQTTLLDAPTDTAPPAVVASATWGLDAPPTAADRASANLRATVNSLGATQPEWADRLPSAAEVGSLSWVFARDGSLTVRTAGGWWAGCSLPVRASRQQLRTLDVPGPTACFLDPPHPAHLRSALDKLGPAQAVVALVLDEAALPVLLAADDLSAEVAAHRLWFVAGASWPDQLRDLFRDRPGLAPPTQFVRLTLPDCGRLDPVIAECRRVLAEVAAERSAVARSYADGWERRADSRAAAAGDFRRLCVVVARTFRLGDEAGPALAGLAVAEEDGAPDVLSDLLVGDDPASGSTLEMLRRAAAADALLTADFARAELPDLLPPDLPWVTWVTTPRVPPAAAAGPNDRLVLAEPAWVAAARAAGWPAEAVAVGGWPLAAHPTPPRGDGGGHVAVLADTTSLDAPARLEEFSSHRLLWNAIRDELTADPTAVGTDVNAFLDARVGRFDVDPAALDRLQFVRGVIAGAVAQTVVRRLAADGVPVRAYGSGWEVVPGLAAVAAGPLRSRADLAAAAWRAAGVLDVRPVGYRSGLHALGRPVVGCGGRTHRAIRQEVAAALAGRAAPPPPIPPISVRLVRDLLLAGR